MGVVTDPLGAGRALWKEARGAAEREALGREVEATLRLAHPALRGVRAVASGDDGLVVVLEHVEGKTLEDARFVGAAEVEGVLVALLRALLHLHAHGLAHGDVKPANVVVADDGRATLIDLGLATPLGATARGGTHGFVAPELLRGEPVSPASDLYALARTMRVVGSKYDGALRALLDACGAQDPRDRPASSEAALAMLGKTSRPVDRAGIVALRGDGAALAAARAVIAKDGGETVVVRGGRGAGRSRLVAELVRDAARAARPVADLAVRGGHDALGALASLFALRGDERVRAVLRAHDTGAAAVILDDADAADEDTAAALPDVVAALAARGKGALIVVGAGDALAEALAARGATSVSLPALEAADVRALAEAVGARTDTATLRAVVGATSGRAGATVRALEALAEQPELSAADLAELARASLRDAPRAAPPSRATAPGLALAALDAGAPRRAVRLLRDAFGDAPPAGLLPLLARATAATGALRDAAELYSRCAALPAAVSVAHARVLERLGRHDDALALAAPLAATDPRAAVVAATSALALGRPEDADTLAVRALDARDLDAETRTRLSVLRSDAALRSGDAVSALALAERAELAARDAADPLLVALAAARTGAACTLAGDARRARERFAAALRAAEESGDVAALPPYLMNLATADHALGELGDAIAGYERAALLAERLGRAGSRAAALTNLAGLLLVAGADAESARVLVLARDAAIEGRATVYVAQTVLLSAERALRHGELDVTLLWCRRRPS